MKSQDFFSSAITLHCNSCFKRQQQQSRNCAAGTLSKTTFIFRNSPYVVQNQSRTNKCEIDCCWENLVKRRSQGLESHREWISSFIWFLVNWQLTEIPPFPSAGFQLSMLEIETSHTFTADYFAETCKSNLKDFIVVCWTLPFQGNSKSYKTWAVGCWSSSLNWAVSSSPS